MNAEKTQRRKRKRDPKEKEDRQCPTPAYKRRGYENMLDDGIAAMYKEHSEQWDDVGIPPWTVELLKRINDHSKVTTERIDELDTRCVLIRLVGQLTKIAAAQQQQIAMVSEILGS